MKKTAFFLSAVLGLSLASACANVPAVTPVGVVDHPEASPFDTDKTLVAQDAVDETLAASAASGKHAMIVLGANWCHDSRALAGWFETPRFEALLNEHYEVAYIDVGQKDRNIDVAQRFGLESIVGTPTVLVVNADGVVLNLETAVTWRNSASRTENSIFEAFARLAQG